MLHVHGVLGRLLGMAAEPQGGGEHPAPLRAALRLLRQLPLRGPPANPPPREDHAEDLAGLVELELRRLGGGGVGRGDALAGRVEGEAVEGTHEAAVPQRASDRRPHVRSQVGAVRVRHADAALVVAPGDDLLAHPGLLDQLLLQQGLAGRDEIPPFRERREFIDAARDPAVGVPDHLGSPLLKCRAAVDRARATRAKCDPGQSATQTECDPGHVPPPSATTAKVSVGPSFAFVKWMRQYRSVMRQFVFEGMRIRGSRDGRAPAGPAPVGGPGTADASRSSRNGNPLADLPFP